ncbi:type II toxin-antitoxin system VapC family toxin [Candidatus Poribacteria bacterium]|nr:type II toxin-antitoxin system VapC family toxin [Candidatus Poribacteria bacterium]
MKQQNGKEYKYLLDSSAFFALFEDEAGAATVQELLAKAQKGDIIIFSSFVSYTEVFYVTYQEEGEEEAQRRVNLMKRLTIKRVDSSEELGLIAGKLKATEKISFADAWVAATAIMLDAILVHKDPEFEALEDELEMLKLPYKKS